MGWSGKGEVDPVWGLPGCDWGRCQRHKTAVAGVQVGADDSIFVLKMFGAYTAKFCRPSLRRMDSGSVARSRTRRSMDSEANPRIIQPRIIFSAAALPFCARRRAIAG